MPNCLKCNYSFPPKELRDGYCRDCMDPKILMEEKRIEAKKKEEIEENQRIREEELKEKRNSIFITTETYVDKPIEKRICIVSAQCVYGLNIIKDLFSSIRDIVGGRVDSIESGLDKANATVIKELKEKAFLNGGDAVIAVKIEHTYSNSGGTILSVFATGTVVKFIQKSI